MFLDLKPEQWLAFTVIAAIISFFGTIFGIILKDYFFSRAFESWKQRKTLDQLYQKYRDPLLLSARELCTRLMEIVDDYPTNYLKRTVLDHRPDQLHPERLIENSSEDPYYQRYKLVSTVYRFCSFLGWLELYRQEIVFLNSGNNKHWNRLENTLGKIRSDLADGQLNTAENWLDWKDYLVFREEIRAIGESMLYNQGNMRTVIGYGQFCELFDNNNKTNHWISIVRNFILDLEVNLDFRYHRLKFLVIHLIDLLELLETKKLDKRFLDGRSKYFVAQQ